MYVGGAALLTALGLEGRPGRKDAGLDERVRTALADPARAATVHDLAGHQGTAVTGVVNTVGSDEVVFTGLLALLALLAEAAPDQIADALAASVVARVRGTSHRLGTRQDAPLAGAAELAFTDLLDDPLNGKG